MGCVQLCHSQSLLLWMMYLGLNYCNVSESEIIGSHPQGFRLISSWKNWYFCSSNQLSGDADIGHKQLFECCLSQALGTSPWAQAIWLPSHILALTQGL